MRQKNSFAINILEVYYCAHLIPIAFSLTQVCILKCKIVSSCTVVRITSLYNTRMVSQRAESKAQPVTREKDGEARV